VLLHLLQGHRNEKVQVLEESKVCAKWFHKKFNRRNLMIGLLRLQSTTGSAFQILAIQLK